MTTSSNGTDAAPPIDEDRLWKEEMDQLWKQLEETRKEGERALIKLEVLEEVARH